MDAAGCENRNIRTKRGSSQRESQFLTISSAPELDGPTLRHSALVVKASTETRARTVVPRDLQVTSRLL